MASRRLVRVQPHGPTRPKVYVASGAKNTSYPRFPPIRAVVSAHMLVWIPATTICRTPPLSSHSPRAGVP